MSLKNSTTTSDYMNFDSTLNKALKIIKNDRNYKIGFLVALGINTGLRISDLLQLKYEDLENDSIALVETKTKKKRFIKLNDNVKTAYLLFKDRSKEKSGWIFTSNQNTVFTVQYVNRALKVMFGAKNLAISSHSLRKTFGRQVWNNNNQSEKALLYLSELFNHSSIAITKRYLGIRQEELNDIYMSL